MTALLYAAMNNPDPGVVNALIDGGADDVKDNNGRNALMLAARWNAPEVVKALLDAGADVNARDNEHKSVLDYAMENEKLKDTGIIERIKEA